MYKNTQTSIFVRVKFVSVMCVCVQWSVDAKRVGVGARDGEGLYPQRCRASREVQKSVPT